MYYLKARTLKHEPELFEKRNFFHSINDYNA